MSTTDLYVLNQKSVRHAAEFQNGWGSAPLVWDYLGEKYITERPVYSLDQQHLKRVWRLADDTRLTTGERTALMLTFDYGYVPRDKLKLAGEACQQFHADTSARPELANRVNHWAAIGAALIDLAGGKLSRHAKGAALSCTSVCDIWLSADKTTFAKAWPIEITTTPSDKENAG